MAGDVNLPGSASDEIQTPSHVALEYSDQGLAYLG